MPQEQTCQEASDIVKKIIGFMFANALYLASQGATLILKKALPSEEKTELTITEEWLKLNQLDIDKEKAATAFRHFKDCSSPCCSRMNEMQENLKTLIGNVFIYGSLLPGVIIMKGGPNIEVILIEGYFDGKLLEMLWPFLEWFTGENASFWNWPKKIKKVTGPHVCDYQ